MLQVDTGTYLFAAFLILLLPPNWILGSLLAAAWHELCHVGAIYCMNGKIYSIRIGVGGATIETKFSGRGMELLSAAAGPLGSLSLAALYRYFPELSICGVIQGLYNLIPVYPLDGGRLLRIFLENVFPKHAQTIEKWVLIVFSGVSGWICYWLFGSILPVFLGLVWILRGRIRKRPCKRHRIRVQ